MINQDELINDFYETKHKISKNNSNEENMIYKFDLNGIVNSIKKLYDQELSIYPFNQYSNLDIFIDNLLKINGNKLKLQENINKNKVINLINQAQKIFLKYDKNIIKNNQTFTHSFSVAETKSIIINFFKTYEPNNIDLITELLNSYVDFLEVDKITDEAAHCQYISSLNKCYIWVYCVKEINLQTILSTIHELEHAIHFMTLLPKRKDIYKTFASINLEIPATTFEKLFIDYAFDNIHRTEAQKLLCSQLNSIFKATIELNNYYNNKPIKKDETKKTFLYGLGRYWGLQFADIYQKSPEKANKLFETFVKNIGYECDYNIYKKFNSDESNKVLEKNINKINH